jgi:hypothetical protein
MSVNIQPHTESVKKAIQELPTFCSTTQNRLKSIEKEISQINKRLKPSLFKQLPRLGTTALLSFGVYKYIDTVIQSEAKDFTKLPAISTCDLQNYINNCVTTLRNSYRSVTQMLKAQEESQPKPLPVYIVLKQEEKN